MCWKLASQAGTAILNLDMVTILHRVLWKIQKIITLFFFFGGGSYILQKSGTPAGQWPAEARPSDSGCAETMRCAYAVMRGRVS